MSTPTTTVTEADIYLWAGIAQDSSLMHLSESFAAAGPAGTRLAHGNLVLALMFEAASDASPGAHSWLLPRVRFVRPIVMGDTLSCDVQAADGGLDVTARNQHGTVVAVTRIVPGDAVDLGSPRTSLPTGETRIERTVGASDAVIYQHIVGDDSALAQLHDLTSVIRPPVQDVSVGYLFGLMSAASSRWVADHGMAQAFSYGYDDLQMSSPLRSGATVSVRYEVELRVASPPKFFATIEVVADDGVVLVRGQHVLWFKED